MSSAVWEVSLNKNITNLILTCSFPLGLSTEGIRQMESMGMTVSTSSLNKIMKACQEDFDTLPR